MKPIAIMFGLCAWATVPTGAVAQPWTLARVADTNTPVPGGSGNFGVSAGTPFMSPSLGNGQTIFWGRSGPLKGQDGIYGKSGNGLLEAVADQHTTVPGTATTFLGFSPLLSTDGTSPTFAGGSLVAGGIYSRVGSQLVTVVRADTPIPGGVGTFEGSFGGASRDGSTVTFFGGYGTLPNSGAGGIYRNTSGQLGIVVNTQTPMPQGSGTFAAFGRQKISGNTTAFEGLDSNLRTGIYTANINGSAVTLVADTNTPVPGGSGNFRLLREPSIDRENVAFLDLYHSGFPEERAGYARIDGVLQAIATPGTPLPGGGTLTWCTGISISGDAVAFTALTSLDYGLFVWRDGVIESVFRSRGTLNGIQVDLLRDLSPEAFEGNTIAFAFNQHNGGFQNLGGVYTATIPSPATLALLAAGGVMGLRRKR